MRFFATMIWGGFVCVLGGGCDAKPPTDDVPHSSELAPTGPVTATVGPEGATMRVVSDEGVEVRLDFPAGAVTAPLVVEIEPVPATPGAYVSLHVSPTGAIFAEPVVVTVTVPSGVAPEVTDLIYFGSANDIAPVPTDVSVPQRRLAGTILGFPAELGRSGPPVSAATRMAVDLNEPPPLNGGGPPSTAIVGAAERNYQNFLLFPREYLPSLLDVIWVLRAYTDVYPFLPVPVPIPPEATEAASDWVSAHRPLACTALEAATSTFRGAFLPVLSSFKTAAEPMFDWTAVDSALGGGCTSSAQLAALEAKAAALVSLFQVTLAGTHTLNELRDLFRDLLDLHAIAASLGQDTEIQPAVERLVSDLVSAWRAAAYTSCRGPVTGVLADTGIADLAAMLALEDAGFLGNTSRGSLQQDARDCGVQLSFDAVSPGITPRTLWTSPALGGADRAGATSPRTWSGRVPMSGKIRMSGRVRRLQCTANPANLADQAEGDESLKLVMIDDHGQLHADLGRTWEVDRDLAVFREWTFDEEIDLGFLLTEGMGYAAAPTTVVVGKLVLRRVAPESGEDCMSVYNDSGDLVTLTLSFSPKPRLLTVTASPSAVTLPTTSSQTFTLGFEAPGSTIVKLTDDVAVGARSAALVVEPYSGMVGHGGTAMFNPTDFGNCSDSPAASKTDTFTIVDDLDQVSDPKIVSTPMTYDPSCEPVCKGCFNVNPVTGAYTTACSSSAGCGVCGEPDGCGGVLECPCSQDHSQCGSYGCADQGSGLMCIYYPC